MPRSRTHHVNLEVHNDALAGACVAKEHDAEVVSLGNLETRPCDIDQRLWKTPSIGSHSNARAPLRPEAGAERRLEAVSCKALFDSGTRGQWLFVPVIQDSSLYCLRPWKRRCRRLHGTSSVHKPPGEGKYPPSRSPARQFSSRAALDCLLFEDIRHDDH